jgi:hypothetical protein
MRARRRDRILKGILRSTSDFMSSGNDVVDGRFVLFFIIISIIFLNISSFSFFTSITVIFLSSIYSLSVSRKILSGIAASIPFIAFFSISTLILTSSTESAIKNALFILSLVSMSSILLNLPHKKVLATFRYFRLPEKVSLMVIISFRLLNLYSEDIANIIDLYSIQRMKRIEYYRKIVRAFLSVLMLRAVNLSEAIYLRGGVSIPEEHFRRPGKRELYFFISSIIVALSAII